MISQIAAIPGMSVVGISDIHVEAAQKAADAYNATATKKKKFYYLMTLKKLFILIL